MFQKNRTIADVLNRIGADNFALEIYLHLELHTEAAHLLFRQRKFHHIVHMHQQFGMRNFALTLKVTKIQIEHIESICSL